MNVVVILAHPNTNSFNHAIAKTCVEELRRRGHQVVFHDLYAEKFDPVLPAAEIPKNAPLPPEIQKHCRDLSQAEGIIIIHPNWWGQPPAILTGWVDRVMRPGVAYEFLPGDKGEGIPRGLLKAARALVINTSNTEDKRELQVFGDPLEKIWLTCIFELCGVKAVERKTFSVMITSTEEQRSGWLHEVKVAVARLFPR
jgi:NAD(P)H dehydrogenase (quinone)